MPGIQQFDSLRAKIIDILDKYSMSALVAPYDSRNINELLRRNIDLVQEADSYDKTMQMIKDKLSLDPRVFLAEEDCEELWEIYNEWRNLL
jgi:hypothetical protein